MIYTLFQVCNIWKISVNQFSSGAQRRVEVIHVNQLVHIVDFIKQFRGLKKPQISSLFDA